MIEDKLTPEQRLRLECLAQANVTRGVNGSVSGVLEAAKQYEAFVRGNGVRS